MARRPANVSWLGFTSAQVGLLELLDHVGNNGWDRNGRSEELVPDVLGELHALGVSIDEIKSAMKSVGYGNRDLHQLDRWESRRTTGRFAR